MFIIAIRYGLIASSVIIAGFILAFNIIDGSLTVAETIGWSSMAIGMILIYLATRSARLQAPGGKIAFTDALMVGAIMSVMMTLAWVFGFEVVMGDRFDEIMAGTEWAELYKDPVVRWVMSAGEILPIALVVSLVSSLVESRREAA